MKQLVNNSFPNEIVRTYFISLISLLQEEKGQTQEEGYYKVNAGRWGYKKHEKKSMNGLKLMKFASVITR